MQTLNVSKRSNSSIEGVPVIDIDRLDQADTLAAIDHACREWGFFQVVGHGVGDDLAAEIMNEGRRFFAMPREHKLELERTERNPWGYFDRELTKNEVDWKQVFDVGPCDKAAGIVAQWPSWTPSFQSSVLKYYDAAETLAFALLAAIERNLGAPSGDLSCDFTPRHTSFLRLNYYPPHAGAPTAPTDLMGVNEHTDAGVLTVLLQDDQAGLEGFRNDGWHLVEPRRDALVINIGDILQVWSNDQYQAALHRVVTNTTDDRISVPFFLSPSYGTNYAPLPSTVDAAHPARYRPINWGEFRSARTAGDFADLGEEIQITHFRHPRD